MSEFDGPVGEVLLRELLLFKAIAEHSQAVIGAKGLDGRYLYVNSQYSRLFHRDCEEFIGHYDAEIFPAEIAEAFRKADLKAQKRKTGLVVEEVAPVDGELRHYLSVKFPIRDAQGQLYATGVVATDITKLRRLTDELKTLAETDPLTGVLNRRKFFELAQREVQRAQRYVLPLSLVMFDLDHFKQVNDSYGHAVGDRVLTELTRLLCEHVRRQDLVGRLGGEEFAVLLPHTGAAQAVDWVRNLQRRLRLWRLELEEAGEVRLTVSAGACQLQDEHEDFDALLRQADRLLYQAKAEGRDRVVGCSG